MTITEFLLARISEDEELAHEVASDRQGNFTGSKLWAAETNGWVAVGASAERVLAECAAKRAIIGRIPKLSDEYRPDWFTGKSALYILATVYSNHPDYQQEWAL